MKFPSRSTRKKRLRPERTEVLRLSDGRELWLRPVCPADRGPIAGGFTLLGEDEVRRRYLHPVKELSEDYLQQLVNPVPGESFAVVAAEPLPPGEALVGALARVNREPGKDSAEFAILVSRFVAGNGLGTLLMRRLIEWAEANGIRQLWGEVMDDNTPMIRLAQSLGFQRDTSEESPNLLRVSLDLAPAPRRRR
jgi:RimJ/RimL family protein N-acetyltransferase